MIFLSLSPAGGAGLPGITVDMHGAQIAFDTLLEGVARGRGGSASGGRYAIKCITAQADGPPKHLLQRLLDLASAAGRLDLLLEEALPRRRLQLEHEDAVDHTADAAR